METTARENAIRNLAGQHFCSNVVQATLNDFDWQETYPVVDADGNLTGETLTDDTFPGYLIVTVNTDGITYSEGADSDALLSIEDAEALGLI